MQTRKLSSLDVGVVGLGTARTFDVSAPDQVATTQAIMDNCISADVSFVDTSPMYGLSEEVLGVTTRANGTVSSSPPRSGAGARARAATRSPGPSSSSRPITSRYSRYTTWWTGAPTFLHWSA